MSNECMYEPIEAETYIPDKYEIDCDGHSVDVISSAWYSYKIALHFSSTTDKEKEVVINITPKEARELRKELKHALALVAIADDI